MLSVVSRCLAIVMMVFALPLSAAMDVQVRGLFKNTAVLEINGRQQILKVGETSQEGVTLVMASPRQAVIEVDGEQQTLGLSQRISSSYRVAEKKEFSIPLNRASQYITTAEINGRRVKVLVDTGASTIAMSSEQARQIGLRYATDGATVTVATASGMAPAHAVVLNTVNVGGITASRVSAMVIQGNYPSVMLLGMSYLQHVNIRENDDIMYLKSKY